MDGEPTQQPAKYMTVPEKIELTAEGGGYQDASRERYRPMKVPDKITLEAASAPPIGGDGGDTKLGGGGGGVRGGGYTQSEVGRQGIPEATSVPLRNVQSAPHPQVAEPVGSNPVTNAAILDLEQRMRTVELQVKRLTETVVNSRPGRATNEPQGNGFWYVLTFAGWMMVPLVVAFMYQYKRFR